MGFASHAYREKTVRAVRSRVNPIRPSQPRQTAIQGIQSRSHSIAIPGYHRLNPEATPQLMTQSPRQAPVINALTTLLEQAGARAAALCDNAIEDGYPLDSTAVIALRQQVRAIDLFILQASATPTP